MNQKEIGSFLKDLRREKGITQEQLAEQLNVSDRTVSRWETGSNLPDISLLVELANFYNLGVNEIIEGRKESEKMDEKTEDVANKMADYATQEKNVLLKRIQIVSIVGVLVLLASIMMQTVSVEPEDINKGVLVVTFISLIIMSVITLYVTGLLEKIVKHKRVMKGIAIATVMGLIVAARQIIVAGIITGVLLFSYGSASVEVYDDITHYQEYMSFSNGAYEEGTDTQWTKWGMDETIWPEKITETMAVSDFKMVYYNPWDAQYLGYLVVDYTPEEYSKEVERLKSYDSTEYVGYYCTQEEKTYELLAINADSYQGFVYALTDGKGRIIYAEQIFCNYFMDLEYEKYIPREYLLDGFDATDSSSYYEKMMEKKETILWLYNTVT